MTAAASKYIYFSTTNSVFNILFLHILGTECLYVFLGCWSKAVCTTVIKLQYNKVLLQLYGRPKWLYEEQLVIQVLGTCSQHFVVMVEDVDIRLVSSYLCLPLSCLVFITNLLVGMVYWTKVGSGCEKYHLHQPPVTFGSFLISTLLMYFMGLNYQTSCQMCCNCGNYLCYYNKITTEMLIQQNSINC